MELISILLPLAPKEICTIAEYSEEPPSCTAIFIRLKGVTVLLITVYLWSGQGLSDDNFRIIKQLLIIIELHNIPFIIVGDFNILPELLLDSGWLVGMSATVMRPENVDSTLNNVPNIIIEYLIVSNSILHLIIFLVADINTTTLPHGLRFGISHGPRAFLTRVLKCPSPLPIKQAVLELNKINDNDISKIYRKANNKTRMKLSRQKGRTGVAILGKPSEALLNDPKFQGDFLTHSVNSGEEMALASLTTEYFILMLANIDPYVMHRFIGRGQYPSFKYKPLTPRKGPEHRYACQFLQLWSSLLSKLHIWSHGLYNKLKQRAIL